MSTFIRFLFDFMSVFFSGVVMIFKGIINGIVQIFNISNYAYIVNFYKSDFNIAEWILVLLAIIVMAVILVIIVLLVWFFIRKYIRFRKTLVEQESMLEEIASLNREVACLVQE